ADSVGFIFRRGMHVIVRPRVLTWLKVAGVSFIIDKLILGAGRIGLFEFLAHPEYDATISLFRNLPVEGQLKIFKRIIGNKVTALIRAVIVKRFTVERAVNNLPAIVFASAEDVPALHAGAIEQ